MHKAAIMSAAAMLGVSVLAGSPAIAAVDRFVLVNGTGSAITALSIRRFRAQDWRALGVAPPAGARAPISMNDPECAFDIRADMADGKTAIWSGVNLCEVSVVTLRREPTGEIWVEYE